MDLFENRVIEDEQTKMKSLVCVCVCVSHSVVFDSFVARQAPLSMVFSRQEY